MALTLPRRGPRIALRRLSVADLASFQNYRQNPELAQYQEWTPQPDSAALAFLGEMGAAELFVPGVWVQLGVADGVSGELLGDIGVRVSADGAEAELGFTLDPRAQGRGLATEAVAAAIALLFEDTAIDRVVAVTDARNHPAIRLLERLGFERFAEQGAVFRGEPCVEFSYELARPTMPGVGEVPIEPAVTPTARGRTR
jgi:RimJ/RimL family protein N-acetyltransferase